MRICATYVAKGNNIICDYCEKKGHPSNLCFMNPNNPNIRLPEEIKKFTWITKSVMAKTEQNLNKPSQKSQELWL